MLSEKQRLFRWLYRREFPDGQLPFDDVLIQAVQESLYKDAIAAEAFVARNIERLWGDLVKSLAVDQSMRRAPLFHIVSNEAKRIVWWPRRLIASSSAFDRRHGYRLLSRPGMLLTIDRLTPREYEALGCVVSQLSGADKVYLTPSGNEAGIDFIASLRLYAGSHVFTGAGAEFRIVGQSKMYDRPAGVEKMKEFSHTLDSVRYSNPSVMRHVPTWFMKSTSPIIGWFISHNGVQSGAAAKAREQGIVVSDSIDLAEIASRSRGIGRGAQLTVRCAEFSGRVADLLKEMDAVTSA